MKIVQVSARVRLSCDGSILAARFRTERNHSYSAAAFHDAAESARTAQPLQAHPSLQSLRLNRRTAVCVKTRMRSTFPESPTTCSAELTDRFASFRFPGTFVSSGCTPIGIRSKTGPLMPTRFWQLSLMASVMLGLAGCQLPSRTARLADAKRRTAGFRLAEDSTIVRDAAPPLTVNTEPSKESQAPDDHPAAVAQKSATIIAFGAEELPGF